MTRHQIVYAANLWNVGCDTADIAAILKVAQSSVHNSLPKIREVAQTMRAAA